MKTLGKVALGIFITLVGLVGLVLVWGFLSHPVEYVFRVLAWRESDAFDWQKFPAHRLEAAPTTFYFDESPDDLVANLFGALAGVDDWDAFLEANQTQAFIVIQDGNVLYEKYFNATQRDSIVTSYSVAKSFTSALIGIASEEGYINSVDDPFTDYLPELADRDPRFGDITMASFTIHSHSHVGLVTEIDKIGLVINPIPGDWFAPLPVANQSCYSFAFCSNIRMAAHALFYRRNAGDG